MTERRPAESDAERELVGLRRALAASESARLDAQQAYAALANGEVDALALEAAATPLLLRAAQDKLRASQVLLRAVFDGALEPMVLTDRQGRYVDANPAACALYGLRLDELVGRRVAEVTGLTLDEDAYQAVRQSGQVRGHFELSRPDGVRRLDYSTVFEVAPGIDLSVMRDTSERVAAEEALRRSEARFRAVIEKSVEGVSLTSADGVVLYRSPWLARMLGRTPEELDVLAWNDSVLPEDRPELMSRVSRLLNDGEREVPLAFRARHRDGSVRWMEGSATNLLDDPDVGAVVANFRDVSARRQAEALVRESLERLEEAQAIAHVGSWTSGFWPDGAIEWSRECYRIFGIPEGTPMTVRSLFEAVHPDDRERLRRATHAAIHEGAAADIEHRVRRPDGTVRHVHERGIVERDAAGAPLRMIGTLQDITERLAAVEAMTASEERYRRIVENTSEGIWTYDRDAVTTYMNPCMADMLGYSATEVVGVPVLAFMEASEHGMASARLERRRQGLTERGDVRLRRKDGSEVWTSMRGNPLFDADGRFEAGLVMVTNISERRHADEVRARLAAIVESSDDAIMSMTGEGEVTTWNRGAEKLYQYAAAEMLGASVFRIMAPDVHGDERLILARVVRGEAVPQYETQRVRKDGSVVAVAVTVSPVRDGTGLVIGVSKVARDLTARLEAEAALRSTEERFRQVQKMEAVGRLAGGVAHDFNNILSVILSYTSINLEDLTPGDPLHSDISAIHAAAQRATGLTRQLLAFSRQQVLQPRVLDLNQIVSGMTSMLQRLIGDDVELAALTSPDIGRVLADPGQIEQVIMNLAVNARDAMPDGGMLTIETANVELDSSYVKGHFGVDPGDYVMLAMSDTGVGMDAATQARIFEPFFTTKEAGKGTGLGLSTVFGIIEQSGGHIGVYSEPGQGSTFKVYLRRTERAADLAPALGPRAVLRGSETVLVVEDDEQLRAVTCAILRRNGYDVIETANGGEAFLVSLEREAPIHLLLTDVVMPRMNGRKLAEQLVLQRPDMKVLYASGYTDDAIVHHGVLSADVAFLQKPFTPDALLRRVRSVLDRVEP